MKPNSHINLDLVMANISQLPTLEEMKEQYIRCRREWNDMEHPTSETGMTRMEMYTTFNSPNAELLDAYEVQELFKLVSRDSVKYANKASSSNRTASNTATWCIPKAGW